MPGNIVKKLEKFPSKQLQQWIDLLQSCSWLQMSQRLDGLTGWKYRAIWASAG